MYKKFLTIGIGLGRKNYIASFCRLLVRLLNNILKKVDAWRNFRLFTLLVKYYFRLDPALYNSQTGYCMKVADIFYFIGSRL